MVRFQKSVGSVAGNAVVLTVMDAGGGALNGRLSAPSMFGQGQRFTTTPLTDPDLDLAVVLAAKLAEAHGVGVVLVEDPQMLWVQPMHTLAAVAAQAEGILPRTLESGAPAADAKPTKPRWLGTLSAQTRRSPAFSRTRLTA